MFYIQIKFNIFFISALTIFTNALDNSDFQSIHRLRKRQQFTNNQNYQKCITPTGEGGFCKPVRYCNLPELQNNMLKSLDYLCIIEQVTIGICCPSFRRGGHLIPIHGQDVINPIDENLKFNNPEERGCGLPTKEFPKIVNGRPAEPGEWPWMAVIIRKGRRNTHCGGALITNEHILTAAHCTHRYKKEDLFVRLGEYNLKAPNETRARDFQILKINEHIDFDLSTYENDIAVIKIEKPTIFNTYIWPVCISPLGETWEGWNGVVIGWGTQFFGGPYSDILMEVSVPIWSQKKCQDVFIERIEDEFLCAGAEEGGRDSCQGDSGGPLLVKLQNNRWVIVGIVSWGLKCGEKNMPGVYTRVNKYVSWIVENSIY